MSIRETAKAVADRSADAYSADRYRSWPAVAEALLRMGLDPLQAEAVMRSKWTRWAADASDKRYGQATGADVRRYLGTYKNLKQEVRDLTFETFGKEQQ